MSKAILVMDMPKRCEECTFFKRNVCKLKKYLDSDSLLFGIITPWTVDEQIAKKSKPDWCPLLELPEKILEQKSGYEDIRTTMRREGWNACIDAIGGGDGD